jgi:polyhydroxyalkanoate synthase
LPFGVVRANFRKSMHPPPPPAIVSTPSPAEIAQRWQQAAQGWARWWLETMPVRTSVRATRPDAPSVDGHALAALNAKYQPTLEALWSAAKALDPIAIVEGRARLPELVEPPPGDRRFSASEWSEHPYFSLVKQNYLLASSYLTELAELAPLSSEDDRHRLRFVTRQYLDAIAPANFPATNPEVLKRALATDGASLAQGASNLIADVKRGRITMSDVSAFEVGRNIAVTAGDVVFRNELIELIQYAPSTPRVHRRPLVIVPPCINKYYILDLQPSNSFVRWTVEQGVTVFMVSWRNIPSQLGSLTWDNYIEDGVLTALGVAGEIARSPTVNALGFCVGGTLLASALGVLAARKKRRVQSVTLLTTMLDFADPGEIGVYVSREYLAAREPSLLAGARVHGAELAGAFASLRANELVWNYVVRNYLKGETPPAFDLLHWNSDSANLAGPMYVYYLRNLYLDNRLRERGALTMAGERVDLRRISAPMYVLASRDDHIVPWRSAYKTTGLAGGDDMTFVLAASGHIAGVVNPPAANRRNYWTNELITDQADDWFERAQSVPGSWWPHWRAWLARHAGGMKRAPKRTGNDTYPPLQPAPGRYVREVPD